MMKNNKIVQSDNETQMLEIRKLCSDSSQKLIELSKMTNKMTAILEKEIHDIMNNINKTNRSMLKLQIELVEVLK